jgi:hypothetical protein
MCQIKAWSMNLGHEHIATTWSAYCQISSNPQTELSREVSETAWPVLRNAQLPIILQEPALGWYGSEAAKQRQRTVYPTYPLQHLAIHRAIV